MPSRVLPPWDMRPVEVANLLNPAFVAILLRYAGLGYQSVVLTGMPFALTFLVLPLVLHKPTRDALPKSTRTKLHSWLVSEPQIQIGYYERTIQMVPFVREGMIFGLSSELFSLTENGCIQVPQSKLKNAPKWANNSEPAVCRSKAEFVGKWFAQVGNTSTIYSILGVQT